MKKILLLCSLLACSLGVSYAQTTAVTATVVDSDGTTWANGKWSIAWTPGPSNPNINAYTNNGAPLSNSVAYQSGTLNGSGVLSVTVYDSSVTFPTGSGWALSVCSNTSAPCSTYNFATAGGSQNISAALTTNIAAPRFKAVSGTYGYVDTEATLSVSTGATYWNVTSAASRCYSGSAWGVCSTGAANAITALTSDVLANGPGSAAATVVKINGATVPINQPCLGSNGSGQPIPGTCTGGGGGAVVACAGSNDSAAINTALATGGLVILTGTCAIPSTPLVIPSNTTLNAANATVTCAIAPCISNTQFTAQTVNRSFADAVTTAASQTLTSATAAFTQADVGQSIRCTGALGASAPTITGFPGVGNTTLYTTIVTVTNGTTATLADPAGASVNPSTCSILYRDHNIAMTGGRWIFTGPNVSSATVQHLLFGTIYDLRLENMWFQNGAGGTTTNVGSKNIGITDASRFKVQGMTFHSWVTLQDGIDIYGPARDFTVRDIFGHTGDNSVAVTMFSAGGTVYSPGQGVVDGGLIENVDTSAGFGAIRLFGNDGGTPVKINAVTVRHYHGAANFAAQAGGGTGDGVELFYGLAFDNIIIDDVSGLISQCDVNLEGITAGTVTISNLSQSWSTFNSNGSLLCGKQGLINTVGDNISNLIVRGGGLNTNNVDHVVTFGGPTSPTVHTLSKASFCDFKLTGLGGATSGGVFTFANTTGSFDFCNDDLNFNTSTANTNVSGIFSFSGPGTVSVSAHGVHADYTNGSLGAGPLFSFVGVSGVYPTFGPIVLNDVSYTSPVALATPPYLFANASPTGLAPLMSNIVLDHVAGCFSGAVGSPQLSNFLGTNLGTPASCNLFGAAGGNSFNILNVSNVAAATAVFTAYTSITASELISIKCSIETGAVTGTATASPFFTYGAGQFLTGPVLTMAANAAVSWEAPAIVVTPGTAVRFQINYAAGSGGSYNAKCNLVKY